MVAHLDQEGVAAADHERHEREDRLRALRLVGVEQPRGVDVALEVVHRHQRQTGVPGQRAGHRDADEQRAGEARALGDRDAVEVAQVVDARTRRSASSSTGHHPAQVGACGHLGHDATGARVERDLAGHDVGDDAAATLDDRHGCLVAGALDGQQPDAHAGRVAAAPSGRAVVAP